MSTVFFSSSLLRRISSSLSLFTSTVRVADFSSGIMGSMSAAVAAAPVFLLAILLIASILLNVIFAQAERLARFDNLRVKSRIALGHSPKRLAGRHTVENRRLYRVHRELVGFCGDFGDYRVVNVLFRLDQAVVLKLDFGLQVLVTIRELADDFFLSLVQDDLRDIARNFGVKPFTQGLEFLPLAFGQLSQLGEVLVLVVQTFQPFICFFKGCLRLFNLRLQLLP